MSQQFQWEPGLAVAHMLYDDFPNETEGELSRLRASLGNKTYLILRNLLQLDAQGNHTPVDFYEYVRDLNDDWLNEALAEQDAR